MAMLLRGGQVYYQGQLQTDDVLIKDGVIQAVAPRLMVDSDTVQVIDVPGKLVTPGLVDVHVHYREPGQTAKETIQTGSMAAAHGGFTTVVTMANVDPVPDTPEQFAKQVALNQTKGLVHIYQNSPVTKDLTSDQIVDMATMKKLGAVGFSNDGHGIQNAKTMYDAMQQAAQVGLPIAAHVQDDALYDHGVMNAGPVAQRLGLPGILGVSESSQVARDLDLAAATGVHYHVCHVSTQASVALIREAKARGVKVTAEVAPHHLLFSDEDILTDDSNFKMNPPLRTESDRQALIQGLLDGTIDLIATDHAPHTEDDKAGGMCHAAFGITGSETAFASLYTEFVRAGVFTLTQLLDWLTLAPAKTFNLPAGELMIGNPADVSVFDLEQSFVYQTTDYLSKGQNTPLTGRAMYGQTRLTLVNGQVVYQQED